MNDIAELMLGLTQAQRDAAERLELAHGMDLFLRHTATGWKATLITPGGHAQTATGEAIGPFLITTAERWAPEPRYPAT